MLPRRDKCSASSLRLALAGIGLGFLLFSPAAAFAQTLMPSGFFDSQPYVPGEQATIEADRLDYDQNTNVVSAGGKVVMTYQGRVLKADAIRYNQTTGVVTADGHVYILDRDKSEYYADHVELTGEFKQAFLNSLAIHVSDGSLITADSADYSDEIKIVLEKGMYSPCGECIDAKGRHIGWKIRADRMTYDRNDASVDLEGPQIELLGIPVMWLPWMRVPDPTQPRANGFRFPEFDFTDKQGATLTVPYFLALGEDTDIVFSPRLMSRQGLLFAAEGYHRFPLGTVEARVAGLYQLDRTAFTGRPGDRDWRGAIQTSGRFTPIPTWTVGWSYTAFSDPAFLPDYKLTTSKNLINEVYATHLSDDYYADLRLQRFNLLGDVGPTEQDRQAVALPNAYASSVTDLAQGWGQVRASIRLLGVERTLDHTGTYGGVPYIFAYAETKAHTTAEVSWQDQIIVPGGIAVTPYLGLRGDAAWYNGASPLLPGQVSLFTATPIAALDVRWPLLSTSGDSSFLFEPVAQVVYRGSNTTAPGITNDNALSFVFDDTNLFSYDRFSGSDRQETGLRANLGAHYLANLGDGSWIDLLAGQSYFLGGTNSLAVADTAQVGLSTGLGLPTSYFVVGAKAGIDNTFEVGVKAQIDTNNPRLALLAAGTRYSNDGWSAGVDYTLIKANPVIGVTEDQHEVLGTLGIPVADYWTLNGRFGWDIAKSSWLEAGGGFRYDDGYLVLGADALWTGPTNSSPNAFSATATIRLKGPLGEFGISK